MSPIAKALRTGILTIVLAATAVAQPNFTVRHTTLDIGSPWDLVEGLPGVVVIGTNSTILHPTDVDTWTTQTSPASAWLVAVAQTEDRYVTVGATGPTLADFGVFTPLANPRLQLFDSTTVLIAVLPPGSYPLHLRGANQTTGEALVEVYELP